MINTDFTEGYKINSALENNGIRHSGFGGVVSDAASGLPVVNAMIKIVNTHKSAMTDINGNYNIISINPAVIQLKFQQQDLKRKLLFLRFSADEY